jgi:hypothetical protein
VTREKKDRITCSGSDADVSNLAAFDSTTAIESGEKVSSLLLTVTSLSARNTHIAFNRIVELITVTLSIVFSSCGGVKIYHEEKRTFLAFCFTVKDRTISAPLSL